MNGRRLRWWRRCGMRNMRAPRRRLVVGAGIGLLAGLVCACSRNDASSGAPAVGLEPPGAALYQQNCSACHDADNLELLKKPPKLTGLFQKQTLPSGAPATDDQVKKTILEGRGIMPPFKQTLDEQHVNDLLKYLHTR